MSSNGYREMISSYLWLSFHYTSYKPKSGIVFQVHWDHSWLETTFFFFYLLAELPYVACDGLAKLRPPILRLSEMFTVLRDLVSRIFFRLSVVIVYWTEPQPVTANKHPFSLNASSQGAQGETAKQKQTGVASFQPVFVSSFCAVLSIFVLSSVFSPMCRW